MAPIARWNNENPSKVLAPGDLITAIDDQVGDAGFLHGLLLEPDRFQADVTVVKTGLAPKGNACFCFGPVKSAETFARVDSELLVHPPVVHTANEEIDFSFQVDHTWGMRAPIGIKYDKVPSGVGVTTVKPVGLVAEHNADNVHEMLQPGDVILAVNGKDTWDDMLSELTKCATLKFDVQRGTHPSAAEKEFFAALDRTDGDMLGVALEKADKGAKVGEVKSEGLIPDWNRHHPDKAFKPGDEIVQLNTSAGFDGIIREAGKNQKLMMRVVRK